MTLHLPLKKKWFLMIRSGEKLQEYREINDYWYKRLTGDGVIKHFDVVHFTLGYPKREDSTKHIYCHVQEITIGTGREEWGAVPGKKYFVIKLKDCYNEQV